MKLTEISSKSVDALVAELKALGISEKKLDKALESSYLSEGEVRFVDWEIKGEDAIGDQPSTKHICLTTDKGEICSLSRLQAGLFTGEDLSPENMVTQMSEVKTGEHAGKFFLKNNTIVNPFLQGNQASALKKLVGKTFVCSHIKGAQSVYKKEGYYSAEEVVTKPVTLFALAQK